VYEAGEGEEFVLEKVFLYVLSVVVPVQLLLTWGQGYIVLSPHLYLFSIYQHLQYVPVMLVCAYLIALYSLWGSRRFEKVLVGLAPFMGIYASASASMIAIVALIGGMLAFVLYRGRQGLENSLRTAFVLVVVMSGSYLNVARMSSHVFAERFAFLGIHRVVVGVEELEKVLPNMTTRSRYWQYHAERVVKGSREFLFGQPNRPDRSEYPSAQNYYLDFIFNFGTLSILPLMAVIGYTILIVYKRRDVIFASPDLLGLTVVVLLLLFVDNSLKVGLRQPYPGIISFFLWGILLSRLYRFSGSTVLRDVRDHVVHV